MEIDNKIYETTKFFRDIPPGGTFIYGGCACIKAVNLPDEFYAVRLLNGEILTSILSTTKVEPIALKVVPVPHGEPST